MNRIPEKLYTFSLHLVQSLTLALTAALLISGFFLTCYSTDMETQKVLTKWDNLFFSLIASAVMCIALFAISTCASRASAPSPHHILRLFVLCWCMAVGIVLVLFGKSVPAADAYSVYSIAESLAEGDTSVIHPTESYLSYYPQQIGLVAFFELLIRLWRLAPTDLHAYHFIKLVYVLLGCVIVLFQEKTVHTLWNDERADCLYLLLAGANCPLLMYTSFVYGEIPSFATISVGFFLLTRLLTQKGAPKPSRALGHKLSETIYHTKTSLALGAGSLCFLTFSVLLRKNSLIFVIAAVLVLLVCGAYCKRPGLLFLAVLCTVCALAVLPCVQKFYEHRSGSTLRSGVPAISYFAMGMQEAPRAEGWYNGFNFNTYQNTGMDTNATTTLSREAICQRLAYFRDNPGYALRFYLHKFLSQWTDGTYACRQATLATFGGRSDFFVSLYEGEYSHFLIAYCNLCQNTLYLGVFWFCLTQKTASSSSAPLMDALPVYLGLISALGGFLFHMAWEGNSRYILPYGLAMLPYTARGLSLLAGTFSNTLRRLKTA